MRRGVEWGETDFFEKTAFLYDVGDCLHLDAL